MNSQHLDCKNEGLNPGFVNGTPTILPPNYHFQVITYETKY
jgi:hypothetical protein